MVPTCLQMLPCYWAAVVLLSPAPIAEPNAAAMIEEGIAAADAGDFDKAIAAFTRAIDADPANYDARIQRGNAADRDEAA